MDRSVKRDITRRYRKMEESLGGVADEISCFECDQCGQVTKVRQIVKGITPGGIECPYCHGSAGLNIFDAFPNVPVTYEWYRPTLDEVLGMAEDRMFTVDFILKGGLLRRECLTD